VLSAGLAQDVVFSLWILFLLNSDSRILIRILDFRSKVEKMKKFLDFSIYTA